MTLTPPAVFSSSDDVVRSVREHRQYDVADPGLFRRLIWPAPVEPEKLSVLVLDGNGQQAARIACANPRSKVLGLFSQSDTLEKAHALKQRHGLKNLRVQAISPEEVAASERRFDYALCGDALAEHANPAALLRTIRAVLAPHGVVAGMLYSPYMRAGLHPLQKIFAQLGIEDDAAGRHLVRATLDALPESHGARVYTAREPMFQKSRALGRTFLHGPEHVWTVPDILRLAAACGLKFRRWLDKLPYDPRALLPAGHPLLPFLTALPPEEQWTATEALAQHMACHRFLLCLPSEDPATYAVAFDNRRWPEYIPSLRPPIRVTQPSTLTGPHPARLLRNDWLFEVSGPEIPLLEAVDGVRSIRAIMDAYPLPLALDEVSGLARRFFARMAEGDHLQFQTAAPAARTSGKRKRNVRTH